MKSGFMINPIEEHVEYIKRRVRDNGGYCIYAEKGDKKNKCPKYCKNSNTCQCGMYIPMTSDEQ